MIEAGGQPPRPGTRGDRRQLLAGLLRDRAASFRSEVFPYFRYVAQSGFGLLVSAMAFFLIAAYANLLRDVPPDAPAGLAGAAALAAAAAWTPMRTYLNRADPVFLLPMEPAVLRAYIRPLRLRSVQFGAVRVGVVYAAFLPLYLRAPDTQAAAHGRSLWILGLELAALAAWNACGSWSERRIAYGFAGMVLRWARYVATGLGAWALVNAAPLPAFGFAAGTAALVSAAWRIPRRHALPWDRLIREEEAARRRWMRFLGWFVDVPSAPSSPALRRWAAWIGDRLAWRRERAWHYLYAKTFVRGETFGAWFRWCAVIGTVEIAAERPAADWAAYAIGVAIGGIQLGEPGAYRLAQAAETLPLGPGGRRAAAAYAARAAGMAGAAVLWLLAALTQSRPLSALSLVMLAAGLLWTGWAIPRRIAKPRRDAGDEE